MSGAALVDGAAVGDDARLGPAERLHPFYLLTGLGGVVRGAWGMLAVSAWFASQGRWRLALGVVALLAFGSFAALVARWWKFQYRLGAHEIRIDSGLFHRTSRAIPFDRVQDVDIEQGPLQRLLGLAQVRFETGGSAGGQKEDGTLHTIALDRARAIRRHIRERRAPAPATVDLGVDAAAAAVEQDQAPLFAMNTRRLLVAGLFNFSLAVLAALFGLTQTFGDLAGFDPFSRRFWNEALVMVEPLRILVVTHAAITVVAGGVVLLALGAATGIVRTVLRDYRFRIDWSGAGFRRRRGLLTLTDVTLPLARAQAVLVMTGPVRRAFGWFELKLQSLAQDEQGKGDHVIAPLARAGEVDTLIGALGWMPAPAGASWRHVSRAYLILFLAAMAPLALIAIAQTLFLPLLGLLALGAVAGASLLRILAWPRTRYALEDGQLFVETGWWRQRRLLLPTAKVQSAEIIDNMFSRLFGVATLRFGVAGGSGFSEHAVPALSRATALALRRAILARA